MHMSIAVKSDQKLLEVAAAEAVGMQTIHYQPKTNLAAELRRLGIEVPA